MTESQELARIIAINQENIQGKRYRLENLKESYADIIALIEGELERRAIDYIPFDPEEVAIDY